jgi:methylenetetrahydrofolate dehydrogenase (NADP+)/methenyltetrahydrofolate cyclohydrolase
LFGGRIVAERLDGRACAEGLESELIERITALSEDGVSPHLVVVIVGDDPASKTYVSAKQAACQRLGLKSTRHSLPVETTQEELLELIVSLNQDDSVHGILVQSPLPESIDELQVTDAIDPRKDVDGFHPVNLGKLVQGRSDALLPCTPSGIIRMLRWAEVELSGKRVVVIGRSRIVGMPLSLMLAARGVDASVSVVHSRSEDIEGICRTADVLIAAVGRPALVSADWVKPGAVIIDVGVNRVDDENHERGWYLAGDVHPEVAGVASKLSPVPGGVGPMTIACLMANTVTAAENLSV